MRLWRKMQFVCAGQVPFPSRESEERRCCCGKSGGREVSEEIREIEHVSVIDGAAVPKFPLECRRGVKVRETA